MNVKVILYKDSECDLCKFTHEELVNDPPKGDIIIKHIKHPNTAKEAKELGISEFPCILLLDSETNEVIHRFYGFTSSEIINNIIDSI